MINAAISVFLLMNYRSIADLQLIDLYPPLSPKAASNDTLLRGALRNFLLQKGEGKVFQAIVTVL